MMNWVSRASDRLDERFVEPPGSRAPSIDVEGYPMSEIEPNSTAAARERAWRQSEARTKSIFAAMSEGLVIYDTSGMVADANAAALTILGLERQELLGRSPLDPRWQAVRPDGTEFPAHERPAMVTLRTGKPVRDQLMGIDDPKRGLRWLRVNADPIRGEPGGNTEAVVATFVDVTEKRKLESRLAASAAEFQDLYDNAPCAYYSLDASGTFVRANATALRWMGLPADAVIGKKSPADFLDARGAAQFRRGFSELKAQSRIAGLETDLRSVDGQVRRVSLRSTVITDEQGRFVRSRSVAYDITELHEARERLQQFTREQAAMLANTLVGIVKVRARHVVWANPGMTQTFGYSLDEIVGLPTRALYPDDTGHQRVGDGIDASRLSGQPFRIQLEMRRKDGELIWIDLSCIALAPDSDESMGVFVDITALKREPAQPPAR
jgi:PAS domain S-box-containing protein